MTPPWLSIIGIGEDGVLAPEAAEALAAGRLVVGGARHLALAARLITGETLAWPSPLTDAFAAILARRGEPVCVLASGDPFCFGIGATIARFVAPGEQRCFPEKSAFSLACARLLWPLHGCDQLSFCGRPIAALLPRLQPAARILALSADATTPASVAALMDKHGFGGSRLHVLEALGGKGERIRSALAGDFGLPDIQPLNLLAIEVIAAAGARILPLSAGIDDAHFQHDGQLTKREIRAVTLSALAPCRGELLWDIGSGSGAIGIEWMLRHPANHAIGIERDAVRLERSAANAAALGVPGLQLIHGAAPAALAGLPMPDAVFIGGGAHDQQIFDAGWAALRQGGRLVVNAVTVETQALLLARQQTHAGRLIRLAVERLDEIGALHGFRPAMAVMQFSATKP